MHLKKTCLRFYLMERKIDRGGRAKMEHKKKVQLRMSEIVYSYMILWLRWNDDEICRNSMCSTNSIWLYCFLREAPRETRSFTSFINVIHHFITIEWNPQPFRLFIIFSLPSPFLPSRSVSHTDANLFHSSFFFLILTLLQ